MTTRAKSISITIYRNSICKCINYLLKNDKFGLNFKIFYRLTIKAPQQSLWSKYDLL